MVTFGGEKTKRNNSTNNLKIQQQKRAKTMNPWEEAEEIVKMNLAEKGELTPENLARYKKIIYKKYKKEGIKKLEEAIEYVKIQQNKRKEDKKTDTMNSKLSITNSNKNSISNDKQEFSFQAQNVKKDPTIIQDSWNNNEEKMSPPVNYYYRSKLDKQSIAQEYNDTALYKLIMTSVLGHDPQHDFNSGNPTRTYADQDIAKVMKNFLKLCSYHSTSQRGGSKDLSIVASISNFDDNTKKLILNGSKQEVMLYASTITKHFVSNITNTIFADGIVLSLSSAGIYNDMKTETNNSTTKLKKKDTIIDLLQFGNIQNKLIDSAKNILSTINDITTIEVVQKYYKKQLLNVFKNPLGMNLMDIIEKSEEQAYNYLQEQVAKILEGGNDTCIYNVESALDLINSYLQDIQEQPIDINKFKILNGENQITLINKAKKKLFLKMHPDKNGCPSMNSKPECKDIHKNFIKVKTDLEYLLESCFNIGNKIKNTMSGGKSNDTLRMMNERIFNEYTKFILNWFRVINYVDSTTIEQEFVDIYNTNNIPKHNIKKSKISEKQINPGRILLNAQVYILCKNIYKQEGVDEDLMEEKHFDILYDDDSWTSGTIDEQIIQAHKIVFRTYFKNNIYLDQDNNNYVKFELPHTKQRFIINNSAKIEGNHTWFKKAFHHYESDTIKNYSFCPIASVLDGMKECSISSAIKYHKDALYDTEFSVTDSDGNNSYNVSYKTTGNDDIILDATVSRFGESNLFTIRKKIKYDGDDMEAKVAYKNLIKHIYTLYKEKVISGMTMRGKGDMDVLTNFLKNVNTEIIGLYVVKSLGDYVQEGTATSKYSAAANSLKPETMSTSSMTPTNSTGDSLRLGIAGDQPSACRMIDMLLFSNPDTINKGAIVGYIGKKNKSFLVHIQEKQEYINLLTGGASKTSKYEVTRKISILNKKLGIKKTIKKNNKLKTYKSKIHKTKNKKTKLNATRKQINKIPINA